MSGLKNALSGKRTFASMLPILIGLAFAHSCSILRPEETPKRFGTPEPIVMFTLPATDTPLPINTPNRAATQTALADAATAGRAEKEETSVAQTKFAGGVLSDIEKKLDEIGQSMGYGAVIWLHPDAVEVESSETSRIHYSPVDPSVQSGDFAFHTLVKWETKQGAGSMNCLVAFRVGGAIETDPWYSFRISNDSEEGQARFDLWQNGTVTGLGKWIATNAVRPGSGAENEIILIVRGGQFDAYVNGRQVQVVWNRIIERGGFGFGILQEAGDSVCSFRNNWIWEWVKTPT